MVSRSRLALPLSSVRRRRIPPATNPANHLVGFWWPPGIWLIDMQRRDIIQHRPDNAPRLFNRILAGKERGVAAHGIAEQALVRLDLIVRLLAGNQLNALTLQLFAGLLRPRAQRDHDVGAEPKAHIIC